MRLRSVGLAAFALLVLGTPVRADEVVFTPASPGVDFSLNDDYEIDVSTSSLPVTDAPTPVLSWAFSLFATGTAYFDASISLFFGGGLSARDPQSVTIDTGNPGGPAVKLWRDAGGAGQFSPSDGSGMPGASNGDTQDGFGHTTGALGLALGQQAEVRQLGAHEETGGGVGTHGHTGAASDAGGGIHGSLGVFLGYEHRIAVGGAAGGGGDEAAGGDQAVEGGAVHHQVADHREGARAPRFQVQFVAVLEVAHVELAQGGAGQRAVRHAIHHAAAHATDALAAIVIECHGLFVSREQVFVEHVEHFEERHVLAHVGDFVAHHAALVVRVALTPDVEDDPHYL